MPLLLVIAEVPDSLPRVVEKSTVVPMIGFPLSLIVAVICEVMVEPAARIVGAAVTVTVPWAMVTAVVMDSPCHAALTVAVPGIVPEMRVVVAVPDASVVAELAERVLRFVVKSNIVLKTGVPSSLMVAVIVDVVGELTGIVVGEAVRVNVG